MSFYFSFFKSGQGESVTSDKNVGYGKDTRYVQSSGGCLVCPLNSIESTLAHPKMAPTGPDNAKVYIIGEAPGAQEDERGRAFVGKAGQLLRSHFPSPRDWNATRRWNTVRCRPPENRNPTSAEVSACRTYIEADIVKVRPRVIIGTGAVPLSWMLSKSSIVSWRGKQIPVKIGDHVAWYCPVIHPSYVLRTGDSKSPHSAVLRRDIQRALDLSISQHRPSYVTTEEVSEGITIYDGSDMRQLRPLEADLRRIAKYTDVGYDYETWPLRPYEPGSQLISVGVGPSHDVVSFPIEHRDVSKQWTEAVFKLLALFLVESGVKVCHNLIFEQEWTANKFHPYFLRRTQWGDTMAQAYSLNEYDRRMKSLDSVVLQNFGFELKSISNLDRKDMRKHDLRDVLRYNALDAKWTHAAYCAQRERMDAGDMLEYERQVRTSPTVVLTQMKGATPDPVEVSKQATYMRQEVEDARDAFALYPEVQNFQMKLGQTFNPDSPQHVGQVLYEEFKQPEVLSKTGYSTGAPVLQNIKIPFAGEVLSYRSMSDNIGFVTQLDPKSRKNVVHGDGLVHTNYNTMFATTGRTTSDNPNLQNYPSRKLKHIRNCIRARAGHVFGAVDYGSFEARVIAMASEDENLVKYIWDGYDPHGAWARRLIDLGGQQWQDKWWERFARPSSFEAFVKLLRGHIKNSWTFPLFYGATYRKCAVLLDLEEDLAKRGAREFWDEFQGVKKWQGRLFEFYTKNGYVQNLNGGRKRREPLSYNEVINTPIQGSASDIVVDSWNRLSEQYDASQFEQREYQAIFNIHDDLTFELPSDDFEKHVNRISHAMLDCPFEWSKIVPLEVEVSVGSSWGSLKDFAVYTNAEWKHRYS